MRGFTFALAAFASCVAADGHTPEDQIAKAMDEMNAAMANGDGEMSQEETIQWVLDNFVEEKDHEIVRAKINEIVAKVDQLEEDAGELAQAAQKTAETGQELVDTVQDLFMSDNATYVQAGAVAFAALTLATV